jgi:hypothetical protein
MTEDEEFFAWLDGELSGEAAAAVESRVAADPVLAAKAARHRSLAANMRSAFDPVLEQQSEPPRFQAAEVIDLGARVTERERRRGWFGVPQWAAVAASLALGLFGGSMIGRDGPNSPVAVENGQLLAAASLDQVLDSSLASAGAADEVRIGLTFRDSAGRICRSFTESATTGLACRDGDKWQIRGLFQVGEGQAADYRMAAGQDPRLAALIDDTIVGEPLDAAAEKAARDRGWR